MTTQLSEALRALPPSPPRLHTCLATDTIGSAIARLAAADVPQLVCVDGRGAVCAVVTSAEMLSCFLLPAAAEPPAAGS